MKNYFDKNPAASRRWFVEFDAYNWKLIHTHLYICYKSSREDEAERTYQQLLEYARRHPKELFDADIRIVQGLEKLFPVRKTDKSMIYS
jgi:hypothetical protein